MKKLLLTLASALLVGSIATATTTGADKDETKTTEHKNPITGTKTTKTKTHKSMKDENGQKADMAVTETTKEKTDGTVKKSVEVDAKSTEKH